MEKFDFDSPNLYEKLNLLVEGEDLQDTIIPEVQQLHVFEEIKKVFNYLPGALFSVNILRGQVILQHNAASLVNCKGEFTLQEYHKALEVEKNPALVVHSNELLKSCLDKSFKDLGFMGGCFNAVQTLKTSTQNELKSVLRYTFPWQITRSGVVTEYLNIIFTIGTAASTSFNGNSFKVPEKIIGTIKNQVKQGIQKRSLFNPTEQIVLRYHLDHEFEIPHSDQFRTQKEIAKLLNLPYNTYVGTKKRLKLKILDRYFDSQVTQAITWEKAIERLRSLAIRIE